MKVARVILQKSHVLGEKKLWLKNLRLIKKGFTDGNNILHTSLVKHFNDLLERLSTEQSKDEVSYFYVGDVFCMQLWTK